MLTSPPVQFKHSWCQLRAHLKWHHNISDAPFREFKGWGSSLPWYLPWKQLGIPEEFQSVVVLLEVDSSRLLRDP